MKNLITDKKSAYMSDRVQSSTHTVKTPSQRPGIFATLRASLRGRGTGAPAAKLLGLLAVVLVALFAFVASASAALSVAPPVVSNPSYASVHVTGKVTTAGGIFATSYAFEYSKDPEVEGWTPGPGGLFNGGAAGDPGKEELVEKDIEGLKGGTEYFVRLTANSFLTNVAAPEAPGPYPSFFTLAVDPPTIPAAAGTSQIFSTSATAAGHVKRPANADPAFNVSCHFEYISDGQFEENVNVLSEPGFTGATSRDCAENPITVPNAEPSVSAPLGCTAPISEAPEGKCLDPETTYHLRLVAENAAPGLVTKDAASTFTTAAKVAAPTVIAADDVTEPGQNTAKTSGEVQRPAGADPALDVSCRFEYATQAAWEANGNSFPEGAPFGGCVENPITADNVEGAGKKKVSAEVTGLKPATTYHFRLAAENGGGTVTKAAALTFTTDPAELPIVTVDPVAGGTYTTAHVSGTVDIDDPGHSTANAAIEISADNGASWTDFLSSTVPSLQHPGVNVVEKNFTGLQPNTTYTFRILATYSGAYPPETEEKGEMAFSPESNPITTEPLFAPTAEGLAVTDLTGTSAHISAIVNPNAPAGPLSELGKKAFATHWEFVCTPECPDTTDTSHGTVQGEEGAQTVSFDAKRLQSNTPYEVTLIAKNGGELEASEGPVPFSTLLIDPTVKSSPGASDGQGGYTLQGVVNPNTHNVTSCKFLWGPNSAELVFSADCSPPPGAGGKPVTVEAHLSGLTPDAVYHSLLVITYDAGTKADGGPQTFVPTLGPAQTCPNEALRKENSSLALPECRAYEMVSPPNKSGFPASLVDFTEDGSSVAYASQAGNIANSGSGLLFSGYVADRTAGGWQTVTDLNGPLGSPFGGPEGFDGVEGFSSFVHSVDLRSSLWFANRKIQPGVGWYPYLRGADGSFSLIGNTLHEGGASAFAPAGNVFVAASDDLSHVVFDGGPTIGGGVAQNVWGTGSGVYEFVGTGNDQPHRVDVNNSGDPISECNLELPNLGYAVSNNGRTIFFTPSGGCGRAAKEVWARVGGTTTYDVSASRCSPACAFPAAPATFQGAAKDGSRVYFTTTAQLLNSDTDQTNDLYACDLPTTSQAPTGTANPCSALHQVSGPAPGAQVENVVSVSDDGSSVYFTAKGVLATNKDALGEAAVAGDHNLYVWHTDAAKPAGQTTVGARLDANDLGGAAQTTADGTVLVFTTASPLVATDTDNARDVYRYDAETGAMIRVSTNVLGVAGNAEGADARIQGDLIFNGHPTNHHSHPAVSDDGQAIVFTTNEALSPLDGNGQPDIYLWKSGHVSLISSGAVGVESESSINGGPAGVIDGSGRDIYFASVHQLTPSDGDDVGDIYDARIEGGFSAAQTPPCSGETCKPPAPKPPAPPNPVTAQSPANPGNVKPCPKGKFAKGNKCVKRHKKHSGKKPHKRTGHNRGGSK
jgi:Tol biopolymer transport system component